MQESAKMQTNRFIFLNIYFFKIVIFMDAGLPN